MSYAQAARRRWGSCVYAWRRGWSDYEAGLATDYRAEYPRKAYTEGRRDRAAVNRALGQMLVAR